MCWTISNGWQSNQQCIMGYVEEISASVVHLFKAHLFNWVLYKPYMRNQIYTLTLQNGDNLNSGLSQPMSEFEHSQCLKHGLLTTDLLLEYWNACQTVCISTCCSPGAGREGEARTGLQYGRSEGPGTGTLSFSVIWYQTLMWGSCWGILTQQMQYAISKKRICFSTGNVLSMCRMKESSVVL